ncbi:type IX secretion system ring subunit PorN/GldN [Ichthyobacterium seriolicida]|uniref:Gliding motility protein GldO n=1 Tax=Ichthyobacterium seriolicida TaxID=242600 RepID=A0A1J1DZV6_9FLAO|nr:gliding motility protein GldN [Ichthyobacterium seriolicida]BAV95441.1 gliding motility protein GldO [Ichthyobacterium seriolicida]
MKKNTVVAILFLCTCNSFSQNILNRVSPNVEEETNKKNEGASTSVEGKLLEPYKYPYVDDRDIYWSTVVWERIELSEKKNFQLYFPTDTTKIDKRRISLFDALLRGVYNKSIKEVYSSEYFLPEHKLTLEEVKDNLNKLDTLPKGFEQLNAGEPISKEFIDKLSIVAADIVSYKIKGMWYFNKKMGELKYRILAICPVGPDVSEKKSENPDLVELFWVWYSDARKDLYNTVVFNPNNKSSHYNFDDILNSRRFSSVIYKEENTYEDRGINDYIKENATLQLIESERIKERVRNFELDVWQY